MKNILVLISVLASFFIQAQNITTIVQGATIHVGNGSVIENGYLVMEQGKIVHCGAQLNALYKNANIINAEGKHIYPGIICLNNIMGLNEVEAVRATLDFKETGEINPNVRSVIAFNTDSKILPTALANGILYTQAVPQGGLISGTSSIMRTTGWNWQDAAYKTDDGVHLNWPEAHVYSGWWAEPGNAHQQKTEEQIKSITQFFEQAVQYHQTNKPEEINARLHAIKGVLNGTQKLYIHANGAKSIIAALLFVKQYPSIKPVLVDAADAWQVIPLLKERNVPVLINNIHQLPRHNHSAIDQPFKTATQLMQAGITVAIGHAGYWEVRNLMYNAGTTVTYGLTKEQALQCITLNAAKVSGTDATIGSLEKNKDASFVIVQGDILDMRSSIVEKAFMDGQEINLDNQQKQLYRKYALKYGLEVK
jgi:imidazolonepropionase-like amidohydrolase